jgi:Fe-S-cluster containining protein
LEPAFSSTPGDLDGHTLDEDGFHDEAECYRCLLNKEVKNECRCGDCCRHLIIEATLEDAQQEPNIAEFGSPTYTDARLALSGQRELEGYVLNDRGDQACVFLDRHTNLCMIYATRPLSCRLFDCDKEGRQQLTELGIIAREGKRRTKSGHNP